MPLTDTSSVCVSLLASLQLLRLSARGKKCSHTPLCSSATTWQKRHCWLSRSSFSAASALSTTLQLHCCSSLSHLQPSPPPLSCSTTWSRRPVSARLWSRKAWRRTPSSRCTTESPASWPHTTSSTEPRDAPTVHTQSSVTLLIILFSLEAF